MLPGRLTDRTGGTIYDARVCAGLRERGVDVTVCELEGAFPRPGTRAEAVARERVRSAAAGLPPGTVLLVDGLALGGLPGLALELAASNPVVALVHHPLCDEEPGRLDGELLEQERRALQGVRAVIVTSAFTAERVRELELVPAGLPIGVVEPGVDPVPAVRRRQAAEELRLLTVGSITPRKAYGDLARALGQLPDVRLRWRAVGSTTRDPACVAELEALGAPLEVLGEVNDDTLRAEFARADLFVHPARYEGYGMVVAEALAHGVPVLSSTGGALARTADRPGVMTFAPGDVDALTARLAAFAAGEPPVPRLRREAFDAAGPANLRTWSTVTEDFMMTLERLP